MSFGFYSFVLFKATLVDSQSPSILVRARKSPGINVGLRVVDVLFPVAKGQRELVIGDRQSGKSTIWLCSFVSQQSQNAYLVRRRRLSSVGSMVGGRLSTTVRLTRTVTRVGARNFCALLVSGVTDSMGSQFQRTNSFLTVIVGHPFWCLTSSPSSLLGMFSFEH